MNFQDYILITRILKTENESLGFLSYLDGFKNILSLFTLELPWKDNEPDVSCIPEGSYNFHKWYSPTFKTTVLRLEDVPERSNILIHPANFVRELRGCIAPGVSVKDIDGDGMMDVGKSRKALYELLAVVPEKGKIIINSL